MARKAEGPWRRGGRKNFYTTVDGQQVNLGPDKAEAWKRFHKLMLHRADAPGDPDDPYVQEVIESFLVHDKGRSAPTTYYTRKHYLTRFNKEYGDFRVTDCKTIHLTRWIDRHEDWSETTKFSVSLIVRRPFNWAVRQGLLARNPFGPTPYRAGRRRPMTSAEFDSMYAVARPDVQDVLVFALRTGARPGEIRALKWEHVQYKDNGSGRAVLHKHKTSRTRRDGKPRKIVFDTETGAFLREVQARGDHPEYVFVSRRKKPWTSSHLDRMVLELRKKVGLPDGVVLYGLRHQFGTRAILNGVGLKSVSEAMGHASTRTTEIYTHVSEEIEHLLDTVAQINRSLS